MPSPIPHPPLHPITPLNVFEWSGPLQKLVVIALCIAVVAAIVVLALKLSGGRRLAGGSTFLSGLRLGGPIIGALGACASLFAMTLGYAGVPGDPPLKILAPGFAEAFLQIGLGLLAGAVAVFAHWAVESRIDRQVLGV
jgi:asparagine N-glycosylation enzyme membrane subunit Stt3